MINLNRDQTKRLSEHFSNLALFFLVTVLAPIFAPIEERDPFMVISGLALYLFCLVESLLLAKNATHTRS